VQEAAHAGCKAKVHCQAGAPASVVAAGRTCSAVGQAAFGGKHGCAEEGYDMNGLGIYDKLRHLEKVAVEAALEDGRVRHRLVQM
jgi:hypothetical protein